MSTATITAVARRTTQRGLRRKRRRETLRNLAFLSPWLIGVSVFFLYPLISTVYFSFMRYDGFTPPTWTGLKNWHYVFTDYPFFWPALRNTLWLVVVMVTLRVIFGLGIGLLITKVKTGAGFFRTAFYLPYLAPPVAATMAFAFLLNPGTGPVNNILGSLGLPQPGWFNDPHWSKPALTLLALWGIGAVVTGVTQTMQYYTQPLVAGKVASGVIGGSGQQFEPGYPEKSTLTLPQLVYHLGFQRFDTGGACVIALVLFALAMAFTALLMRRGSGFLATND